MLLVLDEILFSKSNVLVGKNKDNILENQLRQHP